MSKLKARYLDRVVCIRNGSSDDGEYGLVTHVAENEHVTLTVTFYIMCGVRHQNWYSPDDVELTDKDWNGNLSRDQQLRAVFDSSYSHLWYIADGRGRSPVGYGTKGIAWAHYFQEHFDTASAALYTLAQEVTDDRTSDQSLEDKQGTVADGDGAVPQSGACDDPVLGKGSKHAESRAHGKANEAHRDHPQTVGAGKRIATARRTGGDR